MKNVLMISMLAVAVLAGQTAHGQSSCEATDPYRFAAVMSGGHADFVVDLQRDLLFYRVDASRLTNATGAHLQRAGVNVADLTANQQSFVNGVLEGSVSASGSLLDELYADPSLFSIRVTSASGATSGRLNGRGAVLMVGSLAMEGGGGAAKVRSDVAANAMGVFTIGFVDDDPSAGDVRLDFDIMTDSVDGYDTSSIVLVDGGGTQDVIDLVSVDGFTGGRVRGAVRLTRQELERIIANPSDYHLQFRSPDDGLFSGKMSEAMTVFIPAFGRTRNAHGNHFSSDLRLYNPGHEPANVFVQFFPAGATEPLAGNVAVFRLEPGQARLIDDAVPTMFGSDAAMGSLRIVSSTPVVADSEIFDNASDASMGQWISGIAPCSAVTHGALTSLSSSRSANGFRTNIVLGNPGPRPAVAHFELRDNMGQLLDSTTMTLPAHAQMLMPLGGASGLFRNATGELRHAVATMHADTPLFLGSSLVQNGSGDARFIAARDISLPVKMQ